MKISDTLKEDKRLINHLQQLYDKSYYSECNRYLSKLINDLQGKEIVINNVKYVFEDNSLKIIIDNNCNLDDNDVNKTEFKKLIENIENC